MDKTLLGTRPALRSGAGLAPVRRALAAARTLTLLCCVGALAACGGGQGPAAAAEPAAAQGTLTDAGGEVAVRDPRHPLFGARVVAEAGSIGGPEPVTVTIRALADLPGPLPSGVSLAGPMLRLEKDSANHFALPVQVTVPYDRAALAPGNVPLPLYWDPFYERYFPMGLKAHDEAAGTLTFSTQHFTDFVVGVVEDLEAWAAAAGIAVDTLLEADSGFRPWTDGFFHRNISGLAAPGGACLGMALYATWYYGAKRLQTGQGLHAMYRQGDPDRAEDDDAVRTLIARAHAGSSQVWARIWIQASYFLTQRGSALALIAALKATREPQVLLLKGRYAAPSSQAWGHALVVYRYDDLDDRFYAYDPNFPGEEVWVEYSPLEGFGAFSKAAAYPGPIERYAFEAFSTVAFPPDFEVLHFGAQSGWVSSSFVTLALTTPVLDATDSATVGAADPVRVSGRLVGGAGTTSSVIYYLNGEPLGVATVGAGASFTFDLPRHVLSNPTNLVWLIATDNPRRWTSGYGGFKEFRLRGATFFVNPGFETGDFTGWTHETHTWQDAAPGSYAPPKSAVVGAATDGIAAPLRTAYDGAYAARVNDSDDSWHISTVSQTATAPSSPGLELRFYWAAVLEDPQHDPSEQPYLEVHVEDLDAGTTLYRQQFYANDPGYSGWQSHQGGSWKSIPWQVVALNLSNAGGHRIRLSVTAADCALGGHGGYVLLDADE